MTYYLQSNETRGLDTIHIAIGFVLIMIPMVTLLLLLTSILFVFVAKSKRNKSSSDLKLRLDLGGGPQRPPVVPGLPLLGNVLQIDSASPHLQLTEWTKEYGDIYQMQLLNEKVFVLSGKEVCHKMIIKYFVSTLNIAL